MTQPSKKTIYLAGGFRTGWQSIAMTQLAGFDFLDPSSHQILEPRAYTEWDLAAVTRCDIILANMEQTNPGGYSLALEVGFGKALAKKIVLVDQVTDPISSRYFEMVRQVADAVFSDLDEATKYINASFSLHKADSNGANDPL